MTSRTIVATALLALGAFSAGCQNDNGGSNTQASVRTTPVPVESQNTLKVQDGRAPIRYHFTAGANVRVVDATTGKEVARTRVSPNTTVRVEPAGVFAGDAKLTRRPLPADHEYEIWMDR